MRGVCVADVAMMVRDVIRANRSLLALAVKSEDMSSRFSRETRGMPTPVLKLPFRRPRIVRSHQFTAFQTPRNVTLCRRCHSRRYGLKGRASGFLGRRRARRLPLNVGSDRARSRAPALRGWSLSAPSELGNRRSAGVEGLFPTKTNPRSDTPLRGARAIGMPLACSRNVRRGCLLRRAPPPVGFQALSSDSVAIAF